MTETIYDIYGWDSIEVIRHHALRWAWCLKHKIPYTSMMTTGGFYYCCPECNKIWIDDLEDN